MTLHGLALRQFGGLDGVRDAGLLESCVHRPTAAFGGVEAHPDVIAKAVALCHGISENQPFIDGNKRTAVLAMTITLRRNGYFLLMTSDELFVAVVAMASREITLEEFHGRIRASAKPRIV